MFNYSINISLISPKYNPKYKYDLNKCYNDFCKGIRGCYCLLCTANYVWVFSFDYYVAQDFRLLNYFINVCIYIYINEKLSEKRLKFLTRVGKRHILNKYFKKKRKSGTTSEGGKTKEKTANIYNIGKGINSK